MYTHTHTHTHTLAHSHKYTHTCTHTHTLTHTNTHTLYCNKSAYTCIYNKNYTPNSSNKILLDTLVTYLRIHVRTPQAHTLEGQASPRGKIGNCLPACSTELIKDARSSIIALTCTVNKLDHFNRMHTWDGFSSSCKNMNIVSTITKPVGICSFISHTACKNIPNT